MRKYICAALLCVTALAAAVQLLSPVYARQQNTATWTAELVPQPRADEPIIKSDLLVEGGQTVLLSKAEPYSIRLELYASDSDVADLTINGILGITEINCTASVTKATDAENEYIFTIEKQNAVDDSDEIPASATLRWKHKDKELSATFEYINNEEQTSDEEAELIGISSQYNENIPVSFTVGKDPVLLTMNNGASFPPMMRYTVDSKPFVLYDGGSISLTAGVMCSLDFSMTDIRQDITLTADKHSAEVKYVPFPSMEKSSAPFIMDGTAMELPISFMWGDVGPSVKIYSLTAVESGIEWQEYDKITVQTSDDGNIHLTSNNSPAGTYKIVINWHSFHTIEADFYIRYSNIGEEIRN